MIEQIASNPALSAVALGVLFFVLRELWGVTASTGKREFERVEKSISKLSESTQVNANSLTVLGARVDALTKDHGAMEQRQSQLAGKVDGLQVFWRGEFDKLKDEIRRDLKETAEALRDELAAHRESQRSRHEALLEQMRQQNSDLMLEVTRILGHLK